MADEIRMSAGIVIQNGTLRASVEGRANADQTNPGAVQFVQNIDTSAETLDTSGVASARALFVRNLDAENYVEIGPDSTGIVGLIRLMPGECCMFPLKPSVTVKAQANTAAVDVEVMVVEA